MAKIVKTMKLRIHVNEEVAKQFEKETSQYAAACNYISEYIFNHGLVLSQPKIHKDIYHNVRILFGLKSQLAISAIKTVIARYEAVKEQMTQNPFKYIDEDKNVYYANRTLEWLRKPIQSSRPQADLVHGRDYSFLSGMKVLSLNTLDKRVRVTFDVPKCFAGYFDGSWKFGTGKLVKLKGNWYFHIPMTKEVPDTFDRKNPSHIVGIDRGIRFLTTTYDEKGKTDFRSGQNVTAKREMYNDVRAELQAKGTKSAKRVLKHISGRENRWMADVNHQISKALVRDYGAGTLFVIEDLVNVSFDQKNLSHGGKEWRNELRSWPFYQLGQFLEYKAAEMGSFVLKVAPDYTSQRCPKCGRIHKSNRNHKTHEYICDACGYRSNDDRTAAMCLEELGEMYVAGDDDPRFGTHKSN